MEIYVLKWAACLTVFFLLYKVFLEKESFHTFKRGYLLTALLVAFLIPSITFTEHIVVDTMPTVSASATQFSEFTEEALHTEKRFHFIPSILWSVYLLGVVFFGIRFGRNLSKLVRKIKENPHRRIQSIYHVFIPSTVVPHTFLKYVFLNKKAYDQNEIPKEVIAHENIHAKQLHTLDILLIEVLQVVFWFHPIFYFYKQSIKLNHEFLADQGVLKQGTDLIRYQNILLAFSSNAPTPILANSINYASFKKRFTVMKTKTSAQKIWILTFVLVPLLSLLVYSFSTTEQVITTANDESFENSNLTARSLEIEILANGTYLVDGNPATKRTLASVANNYHQDITYADRNSILNIHITKPEIAPREEVQFIFDALWDYGFHRLVSGEQEVVRSKGNTPLAIDNSQQKKPYAQTYLEGAARNGKKAFVLEIVNSTIKFNTKIISLNEFTEALDAYTEKWSATDYKEAYPSILIKNTPKSFLNKVEKAFQKTQYAQANGGMKLIPPPPPAPEATLPPAPEPAPEAPKPTKNTNTIPSPPPAPNPSPAPDPVKTLKEWNEKGASFYWGPHPIHLKEALEMVQKNPNFIIEVDTTNPLHPIVKLQSC